jgi:hypothetical protein
LEEASDICDDTIDYPVDLHMAMLAQGVPCDLKLPGEDFTLFEGTGTGESITSLRLFLQNQEAVTVFFSRIIYECHGESRGNKSKGQEQTFEDFIKTIGDEYLSLAYKAHCGALILSLKHFHMSLVGQGVPVDFKGTDEGHLL